jgi:hypothetical protein
LANTSTTPTMTSDHVSLRLLSLVVVVVVVVVAAAAVVVVVSLRRRRVFVCYLW